MGEGRPGLVPGRIVKSTVCWRPSPYPFQLRPFKGLCYEPYCPVQKAVLGLGLAQSQAFWYPSPPITGRSPAPPDFRAPLVRSPLESLLMAWARDRAAYFPCQLSLSSGSLPAVVLSAPHHVGKNY